MADPNSSHPTIRDVPIGLPAKGTRREFDSMGNVDVPADRYWGAQTQLLQHFSIGHDRMPKEVYRAYGIEGVRASEPSRRPPARMESGGDRQGGRRGDQR
jgi:hypothetical protein